MESGNFPTFACTNLTSGRKMLKLTIPLIWNIENLNRGEWEKVENGEKICGPPFNFQPFSTELWKLEIHRKKNASGSGLAMNIKKATREIRDSTALKFTISWLAETQEVSEFVQRDVEVPANVRRHEIFDMEMENFKQEYLDVNQVCNMMIQIEVDDNVAGPSDNGVTCDMKDPDFQAWLGKGKFTVLADMESILKEGEFADISLMSEGKDIRAHRAILAARSAVFKSMFEHQMSEKASGFVDISDIPYDTLQVLVTYLYSGRLECLDIESASELFVASDKYAVEDLLCICSKFLKRSLTVKNCLEILVLADTHSKKDLKSSAVSYFTNHSKAICQQPDWENVIKVRPNISFELLKVLASK